jgi:hypothetical protein
MKTAFDHAVHFLALWRVYHVLGWFEGPSIIVASDLFHRIRPIFGAIA